MDNASAKSASDVSITDLVQGVISDAQKLIEQQFDVFRQEVREEIDQAKDAAISMGAGAGMLMGAGFLSIHMVVHLLHDITGLPLSVCYGLVAGGLGVAGIQALQRARDKASSLTDMPQTRQALRDNANWVKEQAHALQRS